jgi:hypothetical protein
MHRANDTHTLMHTTPTSTNYTYCAISSHLAYTHHLTPLTAPYICNLARIPLYE